LVKINVNSSCKEVEEGLFIPSSQKLAVTAKMSETSGQTAELPDKVRNFWRKGGTSGESPELLDLPAAAYLKVLRKHFCVRAKPLDTLIG